MVQLLELLKKKRTTSFEIRNALKKEFLKRGYQPTRELASKFCKRLEKEHPGINRWVSGSDSVSHRDIEDIIMDEFKIQ